MGSLGLVNEISCNPTKIICQRLHQIAMFTQTFVRAEIHDDLSCGIEKAV